MGQSNPLREFRNPGRGFPAWEAPFLRPLYASGLLAPVLGAHSREHAQPFGGSQPRPPGGLEHIVNRVDGSRIKGPISTKTVVMHTTALSLFTIPLDRIQSLQPGEGERPDEFQTAGTSRSLGEIPLERLETTSELGTLLIDRARFVGFTPSIRPSLCSPAGVAARRHVQSGR